MVFTPILLVSSHFTLTKKKFLFEILFVIFKTGVMINCLLSKILLNIFIYSILILFDII